MTSSNTPQPSEPSLIPPENNSSLKPQPQQLNYYNEFCKLHLTNSILNAQLKELRTNKDELISKLNKLQKRNEDLQGGNTGLKSDEKKKRVRRSASDIARHYRCIMKGCKKSYGSEGSLNQHLKLKHPELFNSLNRYLEGKTPIEESNEES